MIDSDKRQAIYSLYKEGMGVREISRCMNIAVNTVLAIIKQKGRMRRERIKLQLTKNSFANSIMNAAAGFNESMSGSKRNIKLRSDTPH